MHGSDILPTISQLPPTDSTEQPRTAAVEAHPERPHRSWTLHTPPLRYDVASLEHWLDLNA